MTTKFNVSVGRCRSCKSRVQGRHPAQSTDALGAAASGVGPVAKSWAAWLHYSLGLSFGKSAAVLARLGVPATAGALCAAAQSTSTALAPVTREIVRRLNASEMIVSDETGW
ncbi:MAG: IS66 family transposase, partial [Acidimicrobiales bacterium]